MYDTQFDVLKAYCVVQEHDSTRNILRSVNASHKYDGEEKRRSKKEKWVELKRKENMIKKRIHILKVVIVEAEVGTNFTSITNS